ncbi:MAG: ABC transporter ATP-binding protein [Marinisporobacter sp.]|nr:ABC transporter ATP-binding protein [Marinisporobacter sp.]
MSILKLKEIGKIYGTKVPFCALRNIHLTIEKGEFVGVMGPSGSGKTTLLNMVSTIDHPTSGEVLLNDKNPHKLKGSELALFRRRELGFVFQDYNLLDTLTIGENIVLPLTLDGYSLSEMDEKLEMVSKRLGIQEILHKRTYEVSGGQAQRAAIARAIVHAPSLLLADEPTGNLDSKASKDVMKIFEEINHLDQVTTMMVTHDPLAASYCHRVLFIKDGEIYNEIHRGESRQKFFGQIMDVLALLGGDHHDLSSIRL